MYLGGKHAFICWGRDRGDWSPPSKIWFFYFRILGYGFALSNRKYKFFSERMGLRRVWRVFGLKIEPLTPSR